MAQDLTPTVIRSSLATRPRLPALLRVSRAVHAALGIGGAVLIAAAFAAWIVRPNAPAAWLLLGAGGAVLVAGAFARCVDHECAFCGTERARLSFLVAGPSVSICPDCAAAASTTVARELDRRGDAMGWARLFIGGLPERSPLDLTRPYVESIARRGGLDAALRSCFRFGHHDLARELLERVPEPERTDYHWVNLGIALGEERRYAEALAATLRAAPAAGCPPNPWVLANAAWFAARAHPAAPHEDLERWLRQAIEARQIVTASPPAGFEGTSELRHIIAAFLGTEADLRQRLGDASGALRALAEAEALEPASGIRRTLRARALADLGRLREARDDAQEALTLLRPGSRDADDAQRLLGSLTPATPGLTPEGEPR